MRILGIDPGLEGAFFLLENGLPSKWAIMPTIRIEAGFRKSKGRLLYDKDGKKIEKFKREVDPVEMVRIFRDFKPDLIVLEAVGARPSQGVVSMFTFGMCFGDLRTAGAWLGCRLERVRPQVWQKTMFEGMKGKDPKKLSRECIAKIWPDINLKRSKRCKDFHDGLCDAACMAEYGRRVLGEGSPSHVVENHSI